MAALPLAVLLVAVLLDAVAVRRIALSRVAQAVEVQRQPPAIAPDAASYVVTAGVAPVFASCAVALAIA